MCVYLPNMRTCIGTYIIFIYGTLYLYIPMYIYNVHQYLYYYNLHVRLLWITAPPAQPSTKSMNQATDNRQPRRRDNSKGSIIILFNTNRVYQYILTIINDIFINLKDILMWTGAPNPFYGVSGFPQAFMLTLC